jgi:O-methyltransferase involved in polyketide biosynthesis
VGGTGHISASAFLVNESRARNVALSRDVYAHLWVSSATRRLWDDFAREVYPHDDIELGLRNRFFLEQLQAAARAQPGLVFLNVAAGYTSYPFLLEEAICCIEIDSPEVVRHKQRCLERWQREGRIPVREIVFHGADLTRREDLARLEGVLCEQIGKRPSFCLLEGLTYYLGLGALRRLLALCTRLQQPGSLLACDYWLPDYAQNPVYRRFVRFSAKRFGRGKQRLNLLAEDFIRRLPGYGVVEQTTIQNLARRQGQTVLLQDDRMILPESYAVLRRLP